jgi:hypothetical protein
VTETDFTERITDFDRLMEGENRDSKDPGDAEHWYAVYADLLGFKKRLLAETQQHIQVVPQTQEELGGNDVPFLQAEMRRLTGGLKFWEARRPKRNNPG